MNTEDMLAIQQEIARYSYTFDSGDADGWAELFTEDALWEYVATGAAEPTTRLAGRQALREFCARRFSERPAGMTSHHHQSGVIFDELSDVSAKTRCMLVLTTQKTGEPAHVLLTGISRDEWVKARDGWRIKHRVLTP